MQLRAFKISYDFMSILFIFKVLIIVNQLHLKSEYIVASFNIKDRAV